MHYANNECADQTAHMHSLISAVDVHLLANTIAMLYVCSQLHFSSKKIKIVSTAELVDLLLSGRKLQGRLPCVTVYARTP